MTIEEHPPLLPDWKRSPCLGCGEVVKRHRGSWAEVIGTPSGSWLLAAPMAAGRSVSTDPDSIPLSGICMLGAAHHRCVDSAFLRIRAGAVRFAAGLVDVRADAIQAEDVTPFYLPSGPSDCLFCERMTGAQLTEEHVWPEWLQKQLVGRGATFPGNGRGRETSPMGPKARACLDCNTRWMSVLEIDAKPLIADMWDHRRELEPHDQEVLATWATKMAVLVDGSAPQPLILRGLAHELRVTRRPPTGTWVWASGFVGPTNYLSAWAKPLRLKPRDGQIPAEPNAVCITFTAFRIVFQVVITLYRGVYDVTASEDVGHLLMPLWPLDKTPRLWPPGAFDAEAVGDLAERFDDAVVVGSPSSADPPLSD
ncbi:hypothetical protein ACSNN7_10010 [Micromonospora sp. URMC 105]|uniref:hypothetical protein n=1 Tax=Micromonospora sp. URMC 105 TaxID=3423413 RepID=UPI003F1AC445